MLEGMEEERCKEGRREGGRGKGGDERREI